MTRKLWKFPGGLHMPDHKAMSNRTPVTAAPIPAQLVLPLAQHIGAPAKPVVRVGDRVLKGQMIAAAEGFVSAPIHASTSGTVIAIEERLVPHPSGLSAACIVIETDGKDEWIELTPHPEYKQLEPNSLRKIIRDAGIVGLGGAGFPSFIKLNPGSRTAVETLILNGAECEPYITCDDRLMREQPEAIITGARIMRHALNAKKVLIGVEDNKPEALEALVRSVASLGRTDIEVVSVPTRYPTGGEKQLIKILTGKEVPSHGLPIDIGVVCHNVATAASVYRAVFKGMPLVERIVTVTGPGISNPQNLHTLIGTPINTLIEAAGGTTSRFSHLLMGGPMMGIYLHASTLPITKTANCLLAMTEAENHTPTLPCIRCGECAKVCPAVLLPQQLYWYAKSREFDKAQDYHLFDCIECGCCAYVCPSNIPLVHYYRYAKTEIWAQEREKEASELARDRHEFRIARIEKEKAERAAKLAKKKAALASSAKTKKAGGEDAKKEAIKAAMERAKAKKAAAAITPKNTEELTEAQRARIQEVEERRQCAATQAPEPSPTESEAKE